MIPCKVVQKTSTHRMCETCHTTWCVDHEDRKAPCPFPAFARVVLDKIAAEAFERGCAVGHAKCITWLRQCSATIKEQADKWRSLGKSEAFVSYLVEGETVLASAADELEVRTHLGIGKTG